MAAEHAANASSPAREHPSAVAPVASAASSSPPLRVAAGAIADPEQQMVARQRDAEEGENDDEDDGENGTDADVKSHAESFPARFSSWEALKAFMKEFKDATYQMFLLGSSTIAAQHNAVLKKRKWHNAERVTNMPLCYVAPTLHAFLLLIPGVADAGSLTAAAAAATLPLIYFHGVFGNSQSGHNFAANLTAEGRTSVPLSFCTDSCTTQGLNNQVQLAIAQIRDIVDNDARLDNGYVFMAHSQGGAIARAVIEEMDDHKVKTFIALTTIANGVFHGSHPPVASGVHSFVSGFSAILFPPTLFNTTKYSEEDLNGKFQYDIDIFARDHPEAQQYVYFNVARSPIKTPWTSTNKFLAVYTNINPCTGDVACVNDQKRRRNNYLKLGAAHYSASPADGLLTPWQTSILDQYNELDSVEEIKTQFSSMHVIDMKDTTEYKEDTYGLKTLDARGGLYRHVVADVSHSCWAEDGGACAHSDKYVYPIVMDAISVIKPLC